MAAETWRIRVITRAGVEIAADLPHRSPSTYETIGFLPGSTTSGSAFGRCSISLLAPNDPGGIAASAYYTQLDYLQRVEIYLGGQNASPVWTGLIDKLPQDLNTYTLEAIDSLYLMTLGQTQRQQFINDTDDNIARYALKDFAVQSGDDFTGASPLTGYTQHGGNPAWVASTNSGMSGLMQTSPLSGTVYIIENQTQVPTTTFQNGAYVDADFVVIAPAGDSAFEAGVVLAYNSVNGNYIEADVLMDTTPGAGNIANGQLRITKYVGGVTTNLISVPIPGGTIAANGTLSINYQLRLMVTYSAGTYTYSATVNGQDFGCIVADTYAPIGSAGVIVFTNLNGGSTFFSNLYALNRQAIFIEDTTNPWPVGSTIRNHKFDQASLYDVFLTGVQGGGWSFRKTCKAGWNADVLSVATTPGTDTNVSFEVGQNLVASKIEPNATLPASAISSQGKAQASTAVGNIARNLTAINKYGHIIRSVSQQDVADYATLRRISQSTAALAASPGAARSYIADDTLTDGQYRELDTVLITDPGKGWMANRQKILSKLVTEGSPLVTLTAGQAPVAMSASHQIKRLQSRMDKLVNASSFTDKPMTDGLIDSQGIRIFDASGVRRIWLDPANVIQTFNDGTRDRVQLGNLKSYTDSNGVTSAAGYGGRALDSSGNLLWDTVGHQQVMTSLGLAAAGSAQVIVAGAGFTDLTSSSFTITVPRTVSIYYPVFVSGFLAAAGAGNTVSIRGNIVSYNTTASIILGSSTMDSGMIWFYGSITAGTYTVKMQASAVGSNWTVNQLFHQVFSLGA